MLNKKKITTKLLFTVIRDEKIIKPYHNKPLLFSQYFFLDCYTPLQDITLWFNSLFTALLQFRTIPTFFISTENFILSQAIHSIPQTHWEPGRPASHRLMRFFQPFAMFNVEQFRPTITCNINCTWQLKRLIKGKIQAEFYVSFFVIL